MNKNLRELKLYLPEKGFLLGNWTSYSYTNDFVGPGSFNFTAGSELFMHEVEITGGDIVQLTIDGRPISTGIVDKVKIRNSKTSGLTYDISGRDLMGILDDSMVNRKIVLKDSDTVVDMIAKATSSFPGLFDDYVSARYLDVDGLFERNVITGRDPKTTLQSKKVTVAAVPELGLAEQSTTVYYDPSVDEENITEIKSNEYKVNENESVYRFLCKNLHRFGLHVWSSADGKSLIVGKPSYSKPVRGQQIKLDSSDMIKSDVSLNWDKQYAIIIGRCKTGGGPNNKDWGKRNLAILNQFTAFDAAGDILPNVQDELDRNKISAKNIVKQKPEADEALKKLARIGSRSRFSSSRFSCKPAWLTDQHSTNNNQLEHFLINKMAKVQHDALVYECVVQDHVYYGAGWNSQFPIYSINKTIFVKDEPLGIEDNLWVSKVQYSKGSAGTTTKLTCHLPYTYFLGDD
jgi:prophage tail gpP-like protein